MLKELGTLRVGDAFWYRGEAYIAIALTPDPFDVFCLKLNTRELVELEEADEVELIEYWSLKQLASSPGHPRGKELKVLY